MISSLSRRINSRSPPDSSSRFKFRFKKLLIRDHMFIWYMTSKIEHTKMKWMILSYWYKDKCSHRWNNYSQRVNQGLFILSEVLIQNTEECRYEKKYRNCILKDKIILVILRSLKVFLVQKSFNVTLKTNYSIFFF